MLLSDVWRLSVAYIRPNSRTERPRKTKIGTDVSHVTRDSDTTFKVKRSKVKVTRPLWFVVLADQHGPTVMVTYPYAYMTYSVSPCHHLQAWAGLGHIVAAAHLQLVITKNRTTLHIVAFHCTCFLDSALLYWDAHALEFARQLNANAHARVTFSAHSADEIVADDDDDDGGGGVQYPVTLCVASWPLMNSCP